MLFRSQKHFCKQNLPYRPPDDWWMELFALANIVDTINITFRALQGKQWLQDAQKQHLKKLQQELIQIFYDARHDHSNHHVGLARSSPMLLLGERWH